MGKSFNVDINLEIVTKKLTAHAAKRANIHYGYYEEERERAEKLKRSASALRGVTTRLKNKAAQGFCPCCNQHFPDLHAHMQKEHPDFETAEEVPIIAQETQESKVHKMESVVEVKE